MRIAMVLLICTVPAMAQVCAPLDIRGLYGFQLSGSSTIPGKPVPVVGIGRWNFGADGKMEGISSVNFNGLMVGNPVTGTYEAKTDCSVTWSLQDDSGGWQRFAGKSKPGGAQIDFHQLDAAAGSSGVMQKLAEACTDTALQGTYAMSRSADLTPFSRDRIDGGGSSTARVQADGSGGLVFIWSSKQTFGSYKVDDDCFVEIEFGLPSGDQEKMRGVLVDSGNQVLAVDTGPQAVGMARFRR